MDNQTLDLKVKKIFGGVAQSIFLLHLSLVVFVIIGVVVELFYQPWAIIQFWIMLSVGLFQLLGRSHCPLTLFENFLWEKSDKPERMYCDKYYNASFVRYYLEKFFKKKMPKGTTTKSLIIGFTLTIIRIFI